MKMSVFLGVFHKNTMKMLVFLGVFTKTQGKCMQASGVFSFGAAAPKLNTKRAFLSDDMVADAQDKMGLSIIFRSRR